METSFVSMTLGYFGVLVPIFGETCDNFSSLIHSPFSHATPEALGALSFRARLSLMPGISERFILWLL